MTHKVNFTAEDVIKNSTLFADLFFEDGQAFSFQAFQENK
jgi:hypothetical protein